MPKAAWFPEAAFPSCDQLTKNPPQGSTSRVTRLYAVQSERPRPALPSKGNRMAHHLADALGACVVLG